VRHEIGDGHFSGQDDRDRSREQSDQQQEPAHQLQQPGDADQRHQLHVVEGRDVRHVQELGRSMRQEKPGNDDAQYTLQPRRPYRKEILVLNHVALLLVEADWTTESAVRCRDGKVSKPRRPAHGWDSGDRGDPDNARLQ